MFERFTDSARRTVVLASEEARLLKHDHIGVEHMLLGMIHEGEGIAARVLTDAGVTRERVLGVLVEGDANPERHIPFTPEVKRSFDVILQTSLGYGHQYIGTEHLLIGMIRSGVLNSWLDVLLLSDADLITEAEDWMTRPDKGLRD